MCVCVCANIRSSVQKRLYNFCEPLHVGTHIQTFGHTHTHTTPEIEGSANTLLIRVRDNLLHLCVRVCVCVHVCALVCIHVYVRVRVCRF